jgi:hypothetical protein
MGIMDDQLSTTITLQLSARDHNGLLPSTSLRPDKALPVHHLPAMIRVANDMPYLHHPSPNQYIHVTKQRRSQPTPVSAQFCPITTSLRLCLVDNKALGAHARAIESPALLQGTASVNGAAPPDPPLGSPTAQTDGYLGFMPESHRNSPVYHGPPRRASSSRTRLSIRAW